MSLFQLQKGTSLIETLDNYSRSEPMFTGENITNHSEIIFHSDESFWKSITNRPGYFYNKKISLNRFVISDWIARVPGLFWSKGAKALRDAAESHIATSANSYVEYYPSGKSKMVMGGIGTLLFAPNDDGKVLMSATSTSNASLGIPLLIFPEVLENIEPGALVRIKEARWQAMEESWDKKFVSGYEVPRGYLVIDSADKIEILSTGYQVFYHPFSIMEYEHNNAYYYDFVYMTSDARSEKGHRFTKDFFKDYAMKDGRFGEYLIASNMVDPLFDARYLSPSDLNKESEKANLELLYKRIKGSHFKNVSIDELIAKLPQYYDSVSSLKVLARKVGINPNKIAEGSAINYSSQLINLCVQRDLIEVLVDQLISEYKEIFK